MIDVSGSIHEVIGEADYLLEAVGEDKANDSGSDYENWLTVFGHGDVCVSFTQRLINELLCIILVALNEGKYLGLFSHNIRLPLETLRS